MFFRFGKMFKIVILKVEIRMLQGLIGIKVSQKMKKW